MIPTIHLHLKTKYKIFVAQNIFISEFIRLKISPIGISGIFLQNFPFLGKIESKKWNELCKKKKKMDDILFINHDRLSDKFLSARKNHFVTLGSWYWLCFMFRKKASTDTFAFRKPSRMLYRLYAFRLCALFHRRRSKSLPNGMGSRFTFHRDELITENFEIFPTAPVKRRNDNENLQLELVLIYEAFIYFFYFNT